VIRQGNHTGAASLERCGPVRYMQRPCPIESAAKALVSSHPRGSKYIHVLSGAKSDDRETPPRKSVVTIQERVGCRNECLDGSEQFAVGHLAPDVTPEHLDWVQPGAVDRKVRQHQTTRRSAQHRLNVVVLVGIGVVSGHVDSPRRMLFQQRFE
jgi:hypothetical protein